MSRVENSMKQYLFKSALTDMVLDFIKDQPDLSKEEIDKCVEYMEEIIKDIVPSDEWNIRVHEDDSDSFDEFLRGQTQCTLGLMGVIISYYTANIRLRNALRGKEE